MSNNWAIVVGINQYKFLPQAPLKFAVADALAMRSFLCEEAGFKPDQVLLCGDGGEEFERDATRSTLRDILLHQIQRAQKADNLWFFFSGHGIDDHLMPTDGNSRDVKDTAISIHFVTDCLRKCKTKNIVMILDMCRNESRDVGRKNVPSIETEIRELVKQRDGQQGIITLFSCSHGESSYEIVNLQQGAFTYALLEGLRSYSILKDLARHLEKRVLELHQSSGKNRKQVPLLIPEPDWKINDPILSHYATAVDVVQLKELAIDAECDGEFDRALQLWEQVNLLATKPDDRRRALNKIRDLMSRANPVAEPIALPTSEVSEVPLTKGDLGGSIAEMESTESDSKCNDINYKKLQSLLEGKNWEAANKETLHILLCLANRQAERSLLVEHIRGFSQYDLNTIDALWSNESQGRFGFGIQARIFEDNIESFEFLEDSAFSTSDAWKEFNELVKWCSKGKNRYEFSFNAPKGHLPHWRELIGGRGGHCRGISLLERVLECQIYSVNLSKPEDIVVDPIAPPISEVNLTKKDLGGSISETKPINFRILDLERHLVQMYEKLQEMQHSMGIASSVEKVIILGEIVSLVRGKILEVEQEYSKLVVLEVNSRENIPESTTQQIIDEIRVEIQMMKPETNVMRSILQQILLELQHPVVPASKKLKAAIPLMAEFVSLEPEEYTESLTRYLFPIFQKITFQLNK